MPFAVPTPKGFAPLKEGGRAAVYPYLPGQNIDYSKLPSGPGLAAELGRTIAALHNADHQLFDEAGLPAYDPDTYRTRRLAELDRAAATGHVPTALLARWERALEDVSLWRFAPTPTHGDLTGDQVLAVFDDEDDAATGRIRALTGWEDAKVADPADDFASLVAEAPPAALETVLEAYAHARVERPDKNLEKRARLAAEMGLVSELMSAVASGDRRLIDRSAAALRRLDDRLHAEAEEQDDYRRASSLRPAQTGPLLVPPRMGTDEDDDDVALMFAKTAPEAEDDTGAETDTEAEAGTGAGTETGAEDTGREADETRETEPERPGPESPEREGHRPIVSASAAEDHEPPQGERPATADSAQPQTEPSQQSDDAEPGPEFEPGFDVRR